MGKSASGKDSISRELMKRIHDLLLYTMYTTRPIRSSEVQGREYNFITAFEYEKLKSAGRIIESRTYNTVHGPWIYCTVEDDVITSAVSSLKNLLMIGTLESFVATCGRFGRDTVKGILIEADDGVRLQRALDRERREDSPKYREMCRRFLADEEDFSDENIVAAKVDKRFKNDKFADCVGQIEGYIKDPYLHG